MELRIQIKSVIDIIENELSYSQVACKYDMYLTSGSLNDTLRTRRVHEYKPYGRVLSFQIPKD